MGPQSVGWRVLLRQTSMAVRKLLPQLRTKLERGMVGLAFVKRPRIWAGGMEICWVSEVSSAGMAMER